MMKNKIFLLLILLIPVLSDAQKVPLDNNSYDGWKSLGTPAISEDGKWITYTINPQQGDGWFYIYNVTSGMKDSVARGSDAVFSPDLRYMAYQISPTYADTRQAKKKKLKEDKMPKNDLEIKLLADNQVNNVPGVKSFAVPEKNSYWMAYLLEKKTEDKNDKKTASDSVKISDSLLKKGKKPEPKGTDFIIFNPLLKKEYRYHDVTEYVVAKDGKTISFLQDIPDSTKIDNFRINVFETRVELSKIVFEGRGSAKKLSSDRGGSLVSFIYSTDTAKVRIYDLWLSKNSINAIKIADSENPSLPAGWSVSENCNITFSDDGTRVYFGSVLKPVKEPEDTLLDEEKYKLDIWSWNDDLLQPMQKKQLDQEKKRNYLAVYHVDKGIIFQLADSAIPSVRTYQKGNNDIALGTSDLKYRKSSSWEGGSNEDVYIINIETGTKKLVLEKSTSRVSISTSCKFLVFWDNERKAWISIPVNGGDRKNISSAIRVPLYDELNDVPDDPSPYGIAGWLDDEKHVLVYDRYDIWSLDMTGVETPVNMTNSFGRENDLRLRYIRLDPDEESINRKSLMYLSAFNYDNKETGFCTLKPGKENIPVKLIMDKSTFPGSLIKAKKADMLIWQEGSFINSPELFFSNLDFGIKKRISTTNPQQKKYNWGTSELVEWISFDRQKLQGILYKPEDFDASKKYPMIVYFYEKSSDNLYNYIPPAPSTSIINRTFAVSNGYLVFVPDIPYIIGYPGQSCYNSVMSGTYALLEKCSFIDKDRLGLDGQSWGGYQIAYLVTQTDLFACAYAGAAVSNMISAYGGIRWGTGMSRMFQYEKTQSRIGGTLWDKPLQFLENSPIFWVPKINTPLLLMHNDADDAVPWYQSIEFITALRRLDKPAWLLSYNDEAHNLIKRPNKKDISIRKMQFFDHYLKGAPMPYWMKYGISQTEKGKIDGYNLINE
jgi:dipeptidyl aminopeptidase/acylaminoacyl peptidase